MKADSPGKLKWEDAEQILHLLDRADALKPDLPQSYLLRARLWALSERPPTVTDLAFVPRALRLFPTFGAFLREADLLCAENGMFANERNVVRAQSAKHDAGSLDRASSLLSPTTSGTVREALAQLRRLAQEQIDGTAIHFPGWDRARLDAYVASLQQAESEIRTLGSF